jgi:hypothetical protein
MMEAIKRKRKIENNGFTLRIGVRWELISTRSEHSSEKRVCESEKMRKKERGEKRGAGGGGRRGREKRGGEGGRGAKIRARRLRHERTIKENATP